MKNRCKNVGLNNTKPFLDANGSAALRKRVDRYIDSKIEEWNATVPYAKHFEENKVNKSYYIRHLIETVHRIRLLRVVETKTLSEIAKHNPLAAQIWANYEREEMLHDELFIQDLQSQGISREQVLNTEPYLSTKLLAGFFFYLIEHEGPLGVIAYSYLVEYVNVKLEAKKLAIMKNTLGEQAIKGQVAHAHTDANDDHPGEVWDVIRYLIHSEEDIGNLYRYLDECQRILAFYFKEIHEDIVIANQRKAA